MRSTGSSPLLTRNDRGCFLPALIVLLLFVQPAHPWFLDRGLESTVQEMKHLFREKKLMRLYNRHVDPDLKSDIHRLIDRMKKDDRNGGKIAGRIGFTGYAAMKRADHETIVSHFFETMVNSPGKKPSGIKNESYLRLALALSLLFAHLDEGMEIADKRIDRRDAEIIYKGNSFTMAACYVYRKGRWFLSDDRHCAGKD